MFKFLKIAYLEPTESYRGRNITKKMLIGMILLLNFITSLGFAFLLAPQFVELNKDAHEVSQQVPDFTIDDQKTLVSDSEGFAYQTQNILFFFDPHDELDKNEVEKNHESIRPQLTLAFHSKALEIYLKGDTFNFKQNYSNLPGFSASSLRELLNRLGQFNLTFILVTFATIYIFLLISTLLYSVIAGLMGQTIAFFMGIMLRYKQAYKITMLASFIPTTLIAIFTAIRGALPYSFELYLIFTAILVYNSLKTMKNRMLGQ